MVRGIEKFREAFGDYTGQYVFIGGTACDIILAQEGVDFRRTKDLDIVLIIETISESFVNTFAEFVQRAGYVHINKGTGKEQFYRFEKPADADYPYMIELFSRKPEYLKTLETHLSPIHIRDEAMSLSAILLDDAYYQLLVSSAVVAEGISVLNLESLILFKIKAWLDLTDRKTNGEQIDSKNIKKHKNDILRLAANMNPDSKMKISEQIRSDVEIFLNAAKLETVDLKNIGIRTGKYGDLLNRISSCFCEN